jgi:hypothetical protein
MEHFKSLKLKRLEIVMRKASKIIVIYFFIIFFMLLSSKAYATSKPTFYLEDCIKYEDSDEVSVNICMKNADPNLVTFSLNLNYDSNKLEFVNSKAGSSLNATMKLVEDFPEESRVGIGAVSLSGFKNNGTYYTVLFKVKGTDDDIPLSLEVREATNNSGDDIECEVENNKITFSENKATMQKSEVEKIPAFEANVENEFQTLEEIIANNTGTEFSINDVLTYESSDDEILKISNDGTMLPKSNGKATVKVMLDNNKIAELEIEVQDEKVTTVKSLEEITKDNGEVISDTSLGIDKTTYQKSAVGDNSNSNGIENTNENIENTSNTTVNNFSIWIIILIIIILVIIISFIIKKVKLGGKR